MTGQNSGSTPAGYCTILDSEVHFVWNDGIG
jgi:hypothetical protein